MQPNSLRILSNVSFPSDFPCTIQTFGDFSDNPAQYKPEKERRKLKTILARIPQQYQPHWVVIKSPEYLPIPQDIAQFRGVKILILTDWNMCLRYVPEIASIFDYCFTDKLGVEVLRKAGVTNVFHQPIFGHRPESFSNQQKKRDLDISFCGNFNPWLHGERNRLVFRLNKLRDRYRIEVGNYFGSEYAEILSRSKLVFNFAIRREANMRMYEAMACGAVPFVQSGNLENSELFSPGEHYLEYSADSLEGDLASALASPERLATISAAAERAVQDQTAAKQNGRWIRFVKEREPTPKGPIAWGPSIVTPAARRSLALMRLLGSGYTLTDAYAEIQESSQAIPDLIPFAMPGILVNAHLVSTQQQGLESHPIVGKIAAILSQHRFPAPIEVFFRMQLAQLEKNPEQVIREAENCLHLLNQMDGSKELREGYHYLYAPLGFMSALNSLLNLAFFADLRNHPGTGTVAAYRTLLTNICLRFKGVACIEIADWAGLESVLQSVPLLEDGSHHCEELEAVWYLHQGEREKLHQHLVSWFQMRMFDIPSWETQFKLAQASENPTTVAFFTKSLPEVCTLFGMAPSHHHLAQRLIQQYGQIPSRSQCAQ